MVIHEINLKEQYSFLEIAQLTVYVPTLEGDYPLAAGKRPTVLVIPGGGYNHCSSREAEPIALEFMNAGFSTAVLRYTEPGDHFYPSQPLAVAAALEQIALHAEEWQMDPDRVALCGFSAGGHLSAFYANGYDLPEIKEKINSRPVAATVLGYPVISADPAVWHEPSFCNLLGHSPKGAEAEKFSCEKRVTEKTPPAFIWATVTDQVVPVQNSLVYARALTDHRVPCELHLFPAGPHGMGTVDERVNMPLEPRVAYARLWLPLAIQWLKDTL